MKINDPCHFGNSNEPALLNEVQIETLIVEPNHLVASPGGDIATRVSVQLAGAEEPNIRSSPGSWWRDEAICELRLPRAQCTFSRSSIVPFPSLLKDNND
jgi:hypothetical protein